MVTNPNFFGQSTTGTPNQIEDGVDFPHTGLIKTLALGMKQNYVINGFDITPSSATAGTVSTGTIMRDGQVISVSGGSPPYAISLDATHTNGYHLLVVDSTNTVVVRNPASPAIGADKVPAYVDGDVIIAVLTHTGANPFDIQYLTVSKTKNSLSIGEGSGTYSEEMSITSDGTDVTFTGSTNTNMDFTPSGTGKVRVTTGDLEVQNGNFEVPNGYSEITIAKSITDGGGVGLSAGAPVYPTNYASGKMIVQLADATIAASKYPAIGLVYDTITAGGNGKVVVQGLTGDISATLFDAGSYSEGDIIYLSPNIGKLTNTRPTADTDAIQNIGRIVHLSTFTAGSSGTAKILVQGSGRSNDVTNDGFITTNASSIPTARQIVAGTDISLADGGAGSTLLVDNISTLHTVTTRDNTTTNGINIAYLGGDAVVPSASMGSDDLYYFINVPTVTLPFAATAAKRLLFLKNVYSAAVTVTTQAGEFIDPTPTVPTGLTPNPDQRVIATNTIVLEVGESIVLTAITDSVTPLITGYYVLDLDTGGSGGLADVVDDTTPQLGGDLDTNGSNITGDFALTGAVRQMKGSVISTNAPTYATHAGAYILVTGAVTLPSITATGEQYVLINNSGSLQNITSASTIIGSTSVSDGSAVTAVAIDASNWFIIG